MNNVVVKYLRKNKYFSKIEEFEELFFSHPNYPSVFALTNSLDMLSIENIAATVSKEQFGGLPDSFLAFFNRDLVLVVKLKKAVIIENEKGVKSNLTIDDFCKYWEGIIIAIQPNQTINNTVKSNTNWLLCCIPIVIIITLSVGYNDFSFNSAILLFTSLLGVIISILIIQEKFGLNNEVVSKFCNINRTTSCDSVIQSNKGIINKWIIFSDLPLLFFSVNMVSILLNPMYSSKIIGLLSMASFPVIVYSIWLQKFKIKKWCMLCLLVSAIIVVQSLVGYFMGQPLFINLIQNNFSYIFYLVVFSSFWLFIKPVLESRYKAQSEVRELRKFKRSFAVFEFLSKEVQIISGFDKLQRLQFGNSSSSIALTLILSPSCSHCHKTFEDSIQLVNEYPEKVSLDVLFNINPENENNPFKVVVQNLLEISNAFPDKIEEAISDWHIYKLGLEAWIQKWKIDSISNKVKQQIQQQYDWCLANEFNYTPIRIVNGKQFPNEYTINELKYFINDFSEDKNSVETKSLFRSKL